MDLDLFIKEFATVALMDETDSYGHYPFQMYAGTPGKHATLGALALPGDVVACYKVFERYMIQECPNIYMSIDFPAGGDIPTDFMCIHYLENGKIELCAVPYDIITGQLQPVIKESIHLNLIRNQFLGVLNYNKN